MKLFYILATSNYGIVWGAARQASGEKGPRHEQVSVYFREHGADCDRFARGRSATSDTLPDFEAMGPWSNA